jgi:hypothetical protein
MKLTGVIEKYQNNLFFKEFKLYNRFQMGSSLEHLVQHLIKNQNKTL